MDEFQIHWYAFKSVVRSTRLMAFDTEGQSPNGLPHMWTFGNAHGTVMAVDVLQIMYDNNYTADQLHDFTDETLPEIVELLEDNTILKVGSDLTKDIEDIVRAADYEYDITPIFDTIRALPEIQQMANLTPSLEIPFPSGAPTPALTTTATEPAAATRSARAGGSTR